jgi:hypothetical protein
LEAIAFAWLLARNNQMARDIRPVSFPSTALAIEFPTSTPPFIVAAAEWCNDHFHHVLKPELSREQRDRCRDILHRLAVAPEAEAVWQTFLERKRLEYQQTTAYFHPVLHVGGFALINAEFNDQQKAVADVFILAWYSGLVAPRGLKRRKDIMRQRDALFGAIADLKAARSKLETVRFFNDDDEEHKFAGIDSQIKILERELPHHTEERWDGILADRTARGLNANIKDTAAAEELRAFVAYLHDGVRKLFELSFPGSIATLANVVLNRNDVTEARVRHIIRTLGDFGDKDER